MRNIYSYIDYRQFLADFYAEKKKTSRAFSHRYFASKAGVRSPVLLRRVIDGKRNLSDTTILKFAKGLGLDTKETVYFRHLVKFNQASTAAEKQEHYANLREMMNMVGQKTLTPDLYDYFNTWYNPIVRELVCLANFGEDYQALARTVVPDITTAQARKSVELLQRLQLIERKDGGSWELRDKAIATESEVFSLAVRSYNTQMVELARESIERFAQQRRHVSGLTITCSEPMYDLIVAEINAFKERIVTMVNVNPEPYTRVMQLNMQLFPLSKDVKPNRENSE
jgi:uncharacterized protein (TIGR02147 family)